MQGCRCRRRKMSRRRLSSPRMVRVCRRGHEEHVVNDWWIEQEVARRHQASTEIHRRGLETWVAQQNVTKSVSPVAAITLQIAKRVKHRAGVDVPASRSGARQWRPQGWGRRMGLRLQGFTAFKPMGKKELHGPVRAQSGTKKTIQAVSFCNACRSISKKQRPFFGRYFRPAK